MPEYDRWAVYYDIVHEGLAGEAEYYVMEAVQRGGEVLELGCGTGRICIPMAMSGVHVTGLDNSPAMLALCREKLAAVGETKGALSLVEGDMRDFDLGRRFDFIAMAYRTFMHLLTPEDQVQCLRCVRRHLKEGGLFICNLWAARPSVIAPHLGRAPEDPFEAAGSYPIPEEGITIAHRYRVCYDEHRQRIDERHHFEDIDDTGQILREEVLPLTRAWVTPREFAHLAARAGFTVEAVLGGFGGQPFTGESREMIWRLHPDS